MKIVQTGVFERQIKKLEKKQKIDLDKMLKKLVDNPFDGESKKGDLRNVRIYKFRVSNQLVLLAYSYSEEDNLLTLLFLGVHENFYRDLKNFLS